MSTAPVVARTRDELGPARAALTEGDVAVVMTMGALHEGHARLIRTARERARQAAGERHQPRRHEAHATQRSTALEIGGGQVHRRGHAATIVGLSLAHRLDGTGFRSGRTADAGAWRPRGDVRGVSGVRRRRGRAQELGARHPHRRRTCAARSSRPSLN